ncbi:MULTISPECIES: hypothetical protein [Nocardiopsis]|uniref:Uncharacterized protein n=1 Tax=Nocardiopsis lambiniae TaxID=3075539 RepID=A0ABU2MEF5_9ACTN|nr:MULTISPECIES: hypothetical protein [unclassified Nocardiopsis]MDE3724538.1 hypothetical protein [Nocardiopsis sp. N85]MDT0330939.1 hypothetical protein [Nocardiopsis sp. DSM 44743]
MGHRHPSKLKNTEVGHARARWLLRAELAGCAECRTEGDREALGDLAEEGVFDSFITGFVLARVPQWRPPGRTPRYPATVYRLAPVDERDFWRAPTQHCMRLCTVEGPRGTRVDTLPALKELRLMSLRDRSLVLGDLIDGLSEDEA